MVRLGLIFFVIVLNAGPALAGGDKAKYIRENRLLEEELKLARKPDIYSVFHLAEKRGSLKAGGVQLKELPIKDFQHWGSPLVGKAFHLKKKSSFFEPGRERIKPGKDENKSDFEIEALELADMPSRYTFFFDGGLTIVIRPSTEGIVSGTCNFFSRTMKLLTRPAAMLWNALRKKPYTAMDFVLEKKDAQTLYWSLAEGASVLVYPP